MSDLCLLRSFLLSFPDQLGWRRLMNYADEVLITGPGHLQSSSHHAGLGGGRKNAEKMMLHLSFSRVFFKKFYFIRASDSIYPMNETLN